VIHQSQLPAVDLTVNDTIPVTTPARTLLDLAAVVPADALEEAFDDALRRGLVTVRRLRWRLEELGRRPGVTTVRRLIEARTGVVGIPESVPETRMARLIERSGLAAPVRQHEIRENGRLIARADFAWPEQRLIVEVESRRWHSSRIRWQHDLARRNRLTRLGWRVVHVTSGDLEHRPDETAAMISETLERTVIDQLMMGSSGSSLARPPR
jgi:hypothetical protein